MACLLEVDVGGFEIGKTDDVTPGNVPNSRSNGLRTSKDDIVSFAARGSKQLRHLVRVHARG
jgi:hypothetical protein